VPSSLQDDAAVSVFSFGSFGKHHERATDAQEQTLPSEAMMSMQRLPNYRLAQTESTLVGKFEHSLNRLAAVFPVKTGILPRKAGQSCVEHFFDGCKMATREVLPDDLFVFGFSSTVITPTYAKARHRANAGLH
jgi:hypothetical protein